MTNEDSQAEQQRWEANIARTKEILSLLQSGVTIALPFVVILFLLYPRWLISPINEVLASLKQAGFTSVAFAGMEANLEKFQRAQATSSQGADSARTALQGVVKPLQTLDAASLAPNERAALVQARQNAQNALDILTKTSQAVTQDVAGAKVGQGSQGEAGQPDAWLIVAGADITPAAAEDELKKVKRQFSGSFLLQRGSLFRTVIPFAERQQAVDQKQAVRDLVDRDVFLVETSQWCVGSLLAAKDGKKIPVKVCRQP